MYKTFSVLLFIAISSLHAFTLPTLGEETPEDNVTEELDLDFKFTALHRNFTFNDINFGYSFLLGEVGYKGESFNVDLGLSWEEYLTSTLNINNLSVSFWRDDYKLKIGKFVTSIGVMDYLTSFDDFNPRRLSFYNDENKNISRYANWMLEATAYMEDDISISFYLEKYDDEFEDYVYVANYALFNNFIPFFLNSGENSDMSIIAQEVFSPLYYNYGKPNTEPLLDNMYDMLSSDIENSALGLNVLLNSDDFTLGALWLNSYSKIPLLKPTDELIDGLAGVLEEDKESFVQNYLSKDNINTMIEHFRYNKLGMYFETTLDEFGFRGELAYEDKIPVINELSSQYSLALGVDYKGFMMYNSLEVKGHYISVLDKNVYQGALLTVVDPIDLGFVDLKIDNTFYYVMYDGIDYLFAKPSVGLQYKNMEFTLEYYSSSKNEIMQDSYMWLFRMSF
jgi:hypothetical protein